MKVNIKGIAHYPSLTRKDTRFSPEGVYKTGVTVPAADAGDLIESLQEVFVDELGKGKLAKAQMPYKASDEDDTVTFQFKTKGDISIFDSKGHLVKDIENLRLGGGSLIRVKGTAKAYNTGGKVGVTLYLNAVQLIRLVEFGSGFEADEDGDYEAEDAPAPAKAIKEVAEVADEDIDF